MINQISVERKEGGIGVEVRTGEVLRNSREIEVLQDWRYHFRKARER